MNTGTKYLVMWKGPRHKKDRVFVGEYLGKDQFGDLLFSLRPESGTISIREQDVLNHFAVPDHTKAGTRKP